MSIPDFTNGSFELLGGLLNYINVWRLWKDKELRGVHWFPTFFFALWGYWNLYYYPHLNQWISFTGGLIVVSANTAWVILALKYRKN
jgi:hypothetical protein